MSSNVRVSVFSDSLAAADLRRLVKAAPERSVSVGALIPPLNDSDTRSRIANHSSLTWSMNFADDGSQALTRFLDGLAIERSESTPGGDAGPKWVVAILFDSTTPGDQIVFDGRLLEILLCLRAEFYVKTV